MNRLVRTLLIILAVLVIAGGGFWAGSGFAFRQVAARPALLANAAPAANSSALPAGNGAFASGSTNNARPGFNQRQGRNYQGTDGSSRDQSGDSRFSRGQQKFNNAGPAMMPPFAQNRGTMGSRFENGFGGNNRMSIGGMFMGGGMMLFGLLFTAGLAILMVLGIIVLFRIVRNPAANPVASTAVCAKCGAPVQNGWKHCPHCGEQIQ
jgi:hypothetical protein